MLTKFIDSYVAVAASLEWCKSLLNVSSLLWQNTSPVKKNPAHIKLWYDIDGNSKHKS